MDSQAVTQIAGQLQRDLGLALEGSFETLDGGTFAVIRPTIPGKPFGLSIMLSRNSRKVEAALRLDNQAGELLHVMAASDMVQRATLCALQEVFSDQSIQSLIVVDSKKILGPGDFPDVRWYDIAIECEYRLPYISADLEVVHNAYSMAARACLHLTLTLLEVEPVEVLPELEEIEGYPEGVKTTVSVNRYERNILNRTACLTANGSVCKVCGFDFESQYGDLGKGFIHVHHIVPVSQISEEYRINPLEDLVPLCPNCHAMAHRRNPPISVAELKSILKQRERAPLSD